VNDERAGVGTSFYREDAGYGIGVEGVGAQPVDGLGRKGDNLSCLKKTSGVIDFIMIDERERLRHDFIVDGRARWQISPGRRCGAQT
jgi:hypothetical protein